MARNLKYRFNFESIHGVLYTVYIYAEGYTGSILTRRMGGAPKIKMQDADTFRATSCTLTLECAVDGEYASLYTSDPQQFLVVITRGGTLSGGGTTIWTGFIAPELYSEPDIAPPYDVTVTATDGLGTLKEYTFEGGNVTIAQHFKNILANTGVNLAVKFISKLRPYHGALNAFFNQTAINLDFLKGENCYDVLQTILRSLNMTITQHGGTWLCVRETDAEVRSDGSMYSFRIPPVGSSEEYLIEHASRSVGKMGVAEMWPVGHLRREAVPAKRSVTVECPWHSENILSNPYMEQDSAWTKAGLTWQSGAYVSNADTVGNIYQEFSVSNFANLPIRVSILCSRAKAALETYNFVRTAVLFTAGNTNWWYDSEKGKWVEYDQQATSKEFELQNYTTERAFADEYTEEIPGLPLESSTSGTLRIGFICRNARIFAITASQMFNRGFQDTILINNGARGAADTVEILGGRMTGDEDIIENGLQGIFTDLLDEPIYSWQDENFSLLDFMSITAMGRAMSVAAPRVRMSGKLDVPDDVVLPPICLSAHGSDYLVESYNWDLLNEELDFSAISLPVVSLTVESETVSPLPEATSHTSTGISSGSSSPGGGGGGISEETDPVFTASPAHGITANDIQNWNGKSTLPSVSASDNGKVLKVVAGAWAKGTDSGYVKPSSGIPSGDMAAEVQTSLGKADSALQSVPSDYKKVVECANQAAYEAITPKDSGTLYVILETQ